MSTRDLYSQWLTALKDEDLKAVLREETERECLAYAAGKELSRRAQVVVDEALVNLETCAGCAIDDTAPIFFRAVLRLLGDQSRQMYARAKPDGYDEWVKGRASD